MLTIYITTLISLYVGVVSGTDECGIKGAESSPWRIIGGQNSKPNEWPWIAYLNILMFKGNFMCGGSIISDQWVLTAGHCLKGETQISTLSLGQYSLQNFKTVFFLDVEKVIK